MIEACPSCPTSARSAFRALGGRIAGGDLPVLTCCAAGKERTGFFVAALLLAPGTGEACPRCVYADHLEAAFDAFPAAAGFADDRLARVRARLLC